MAVPIYKTEHGSLIGDVEFVWARNAKEFFFSNTIVVHGAEGLVVDPSANFSYLEKIASQNKIQTVLNTHYHIDHRSLNHLFEHAEFVCHALDKPAILSLDNYLRYADQNKESSYVLWLRGIFASLEIQKQPIHRTLKDQERIRLRGNTIQILHLPGHTPGHIGLLFEDLGVLYISDVDLTPVGPWYANISSNIDQFLQTIAKIRAIPVDYYITSHGERIYEPERFMEKLNRFEEAFFKRDEKILNLLAQGPKTLDELSQVGIIYKHSYLLTDPLKACFERQMVEKHLERLASQQKILRDRDYYLLQP